VNSKRAAEDGLSFILICRSMQAGAMGSIMFKSIVAYLDESEQMAARLDVAAALAIGQQAHLVGAAVTGVAMLSAAMASAGAGMIVPDCDFTAMRDAARARLDRFDTTCRRLGLVTVEQRLSDSCAEDELVVQSRYADLLILSQGSKAKGNSLPPGRLAG
jgi:hypothetical protein